MNNTILIGLASVLALAGTTAYWWRRERLVKESLTASRDWETNTNATTAVAHEELRAATKAAKRLDARVTDLPERVIALDEERRGLRRELDAVRERWADSWLSHVDMTADGDPPVRVVVFDSWEIDDVRAFAKRAMNEDAITVVVGGDNSFAVAVGDSLSDECSATEIAGSITECAGGGAGGTDRLAIGGGATGALDTACRNVKHSRIQSATVYPNPENDA
ncbi:DHHA1 domain-containing protein [Halocatena pleomorpha]|uniref:Alanyl-tRNA synthetase n=1 Tax=Halocatena pleomorpha TaxID=1785090 RepID=A0A3P3RE95_9EURY|nr:DHHA1 domain-containing protein [Halocatena pleomorpha]RRJ31827.1 alanyl-tRNA synthetase [Halocatena pleomorpha]